MCAKHLRESQDLIEWRDIFCQWIGKLNLVKVSHSQIYIQIKSDLNQIPLCFCMSETWQADSKFTLLFSHLVISDPCDPKDCSTPGFPAHHQLLELAQTHVLRVSDAIQPSHLLSPPSPPAFDLYQHQGLFQWVSSSHHVAKVLEFQHQSFQWIFRIDFL